MAAPPKEYHFKIDGYGVMNVADVGVRLEQGSEVAFIVTEVAPMEDGAIGVTLQFTDVI
jgi:hypothetical protein